MVIYLLINKINEKMYIGQTSGSLSKRLRDHKYRKSNCTLISRAIQKYGMDSFDVRILAETEDVKELSKLEREFIAEYKTMHPNGYNLTSGGERPKFSELARLKMSLKRRGKPLSEETNKKIRQSQSGTNHPMFGKKHTEETKNKISKSNSERIVSKKTREKISISLKGNQNYKFRVSTKGLTLFQRRQLKK